jgi:hypothetical protein
MGLSVEMVRTMTGLSTETITNLSSQIREGAE